MSTTDPQVRYCTTSDGVQIAYVVDGNGPGIPVICVGAPFTDVRPSYWQEFGMNIIRGGSRDARPVAWFDFRGCGISERNVDDVSMDALERDLNAVIERLEWPRFAVMASGLSGPVAMKYAAEHPDRVASLVLRETYARAVDMGRIPRMRALGLLLREDYESYLMLMVATAYGWLSDGARLLKLIAGTTTEQMCREYAAASPTFNASMFVDKIQARTLVVGRNDMPVPSGEMLRQLGARIRDARVVMEVGFGHSPAVERFLAEGDPVVATSAATAPTGTRTVLFTDIVDSTALTERLGDEAFRAASRALDASIRSAIRDTSGTPVEGKVLGDGVMGVFMSAAHALRAAIACVDLSGRSELRLHVGLHAGDVIHEEGNVYGGTVNIASRICALSAPGEILVSDVVRGMARSSAGVDFEDRGEQDMKGVGESVRVYAVRQPE
jgi:class 3 adenylate cyclase